MRIVSALMMSILATACDAAPSNLGQQAEASSETQGPTVLSAKPVRFKASDNVMVHGRYYEAQAPKALILLFHQAGSNKSEYASIAPRLTEAGYSALAIDQRSGGNMFGGRNETVASIGQNGGYLDAKRDLEAALAWAGDKRLPIVLWGSSYSASLLFPLAAEHPGKAVALLAFSPGEYLGGGNPVRSAAAKVNVPLFVTSATDAEEIVEAKALIDAAAARLKTLFVPISGGVHGSSTLIADRNPDGAEEAWKAVLQFLENVEMANRSSLARQPHTRARSIRLDSAHDR